jgi:hypothetical protein
MNEVRVYKPVLCYKKGLCLVKVYTDVELLKINRDKKLPAYFHPSIKRERLTALPEEAEGDLSWFSGGTTKHFRKHMNFVSKCNQQERD